MIHKSLVYEFEYERFAFLKHLKIIFLSFMLVAVSLFSIESIVNSTSQINYQDELFSYIVDTNSNEATVTSYIKQKNDGYVPFYRDVNGYTLAKIKQGIFLNNSYSWAVTYINIYGTPKLEPGCFDGLTNLWYFGAKEYTSFDLSLLKGYDKLRFVGLDNITSFTRDTTDTIKIPSGSLNYESNYEATGPGNVLDPIIKLGKAPLVKGKDYDLDSEIIADVPKKVNVKATMKGNFKGELMMEINIVGKVLGDANTNIEIQNTDKVYDGASWSSDNLGDVIVKLTNGGSIVDTLDANDDAATDGYSLVFPDGKDVGTYDLIFEFHGQYSGNIIRKKLTITPKNLEESDIRVNFNENKEYGLKWVAEDVEVMHGDKKLMEGQDYTVVFNDDLDIDSQNAIFTFKGNYSGTVTKALPTKPRDLSNENVIVNANPPTKEYDGYDWRPSFSIIFDGKEIPSDNYSIELPSNRVDAGTKQVKITFKGNYTGTITRNFEITQNKLPEIDIIPDSEWKEYDGNAWKPSFRVTINDEELSEENDDFSIEYPDDMINAGDKDIKFIFSKNFKGEVTKTLEIEQRDFNSLTIETEDRHVYDGKVWSPSIVVKDGENILKENEDYTVTLSANMISEGDKLLILDFKNYSGNYMKKLKIESWGTPKTMISPDGTHVTNYVDSNGETSVEINDFSKIWLYEESNGSGTWYCLDNSKGIFEKGSKFTVKWLTFGDNDYFNKLRDVDDKTALANNVKLFTISVTSPGGKAYTNFGKDDKGHDITVDLYVELGGQWNRRSLGGLFVNSDKDNKDEPIITDSVTLNTFDGEKEFACMSLKHFSTYLVFDNPVTSENGSSSGISENKDSDKSKDIRSTSGVKNLSNELQAETGSKQESNLENSESVSSEFKGSETVKSAGIENILNSSPSYEAEDNSDTQVLTSFNGEEEGINDNTDNNQTLYADEMDENNAVTNESKTNKIENSIVSDKTENETENEGFDNTPEYQSSSTNYDISLGRAQDNYPTIALLFSFLCIASLARRFNLRIH